ncbi:MAG: SBBP repeat-containing protein, partial [Actinomycetota bacterium]
MPRVPFVSLVCAVAVALPVLCRAAEPSYVWTVRAGGSRHDKTRGLCTDRAGNVYLTGEFGDTADFGKEKITSRGDLDFFVAKYSPQGECLWARQGGGAKTDRGYSVAADDQGGVFVTGHYQSSDALFGSEYSQPL